MRKHLCWLMTLVLGIILTACDPEAPNDYRSTVPNDAVVVVKVNVGSLLNKSEFLADPQVKGMIRSASAGESRETRDLVEELLADPNACGIDVDKPVYLALVNIEHQQGMMTCAIKDKAKFEEFMRVSDTKAEPAEMLYYDDQMLVIDITGNHPDARTYTTMADTRKAVHSAEYKALFDTEKDMVMYMDYQQMIRLAELSGKMPSDMKMPSLEGVSMIGSMDFTDGVIALDALIQNPTSEMRKNMETYNISASKKNLKYVPQNAAAVINVGLKGLANIFDYAPADVKDQVNEALAQFDMTVDNLNSIEGDLTLAGTVDPSAMLMLQCKNRVLFDKVTAQIQDYVEEVATDVYEIEGVYFGYAEDAIFLMEESLYNKCMKDGKLSALSSDFTSSRLNSKINGEGMAVDIAAVVQLVKDLGWAEYDADARLILSVANIFDNLYLTSDNDNLKSNMTIELTDKSHNSLKVLTDLLVSIAASR